MIMHRMWHSTGLKTGGNRKSGEIENQFYIEVDFTASTTELQFLLIQALPTMAATLKTILRWSCMGGRKISRLLNGSTRQSVNFSRIVVVAFTFLTMLSMRTTRTTFNLLGISTNWLQFWQQNSKIWKTTTVNTALASASGQDCALKLEWTLEFKKSQAWTFVNRQVFSVCINFIDTLKYSLLQARHSTVCGAIEEKIHKMRPKMLLASTPAVIKVLRSTIVIKISGWGNAARVSRRLVPSHSGLMDSALISTTWHSITSLYQRTWKDVSVRTERIFRHRT